MATYRLTIKRDNISVQVVAKSGALIAHEMDRYLESFVNRKINSKYTFAKKDVSQNTAAGQTAHYDAQSAAGENTSDDTSEFYIHNGEQINITKEQVSAQIPYTRTLEQAAPVQQQDIAPVNTAPDLRQYEQKQPEDYLHEQREQGAPISLKDFLVSNKATDVFSEFIISAYYIKRVLNISHFTLKMINSKFYPITNALIDLSMAEEARTRGFIESLDEDGVIKYTLTPAGESYFINQLRG